jgi:hypothetical protein
MRWIVGGMVAVNTVVLVWQLLNLSSTNAPAPVPTPARLSLDTPQLQLLQELDAAKLESMHKSPSNSGAGRTSQEAALCTLVGPFSKVLSAEYFVERLTTMELKATVESLEIPGEPGYWVFLPSQGTSKQAFAVLRELQAKGIDSFVIPKGDQENGISIGMFNQKALAEQRLEEMKKKGYATEMTEIVRSVKETWVVLPPGQANQLSAETWQQMMYDEEDNLERRQNFCPAVASQENFL